MSESSNIRVTHPGLVDSTTGYQQTELLKEKINDDPVEVVPSKADRYIIAQWGNFVDAALKETNNAFNGAPVHMLNVQGGYWSRADGQSSGGTSDSFGEAADIVLAADLPDNPLVFVTARVFATSNVAASALVCERDAVYHDIAGIDTLIAPKLQQVRTNDLFEYPLGDFEAFLAARANGDVTDIVLEVKSKQDAEWIVDFNLRCVPEQYSGVESQIVQPPAPPSAEP